MNSRWWKIIQTVLGVATVGFVIYYIIRHWDDVRRADMRWQIDPLSLLAGVVLVWLVFAVQAEAWRRMVAGWGKRLEWLAGTAVWLLSNMARYIPGKVWALTSMAAMAEKRGVPAWTATSSSVLLQILSAGTGALVVAGTGLRISHPDYPLGQTTLLLLAAGSVGLTGLLLWRPVTRWLLQRVAPKADREHIPGLPVVAIGVVANLLAWIGYGVAFWLFARGSLPQAPLGVGEAIGAFAGSYVAGMIAPFAPGGLGVRESVLILMLQPRIGLGNAIALSAVSRLLTTAAEVIVAVPFVIYAKEKIRG